MSHPQPDLNSPPRHTTLGEFIRVLPQLPRALALVWRTVPDLCAWLAVLTVLCGVIPAAIAWVGKGLVDSVVSAAAGGDRHAPWHWVGYEAALAIALLSAQRLQSTVQSLMRARLGHAVNVLILRKSAEMSLPQFEDAATYDALTRARREASIRPLSLIQRLFSIAQNFLQLCSFAVILIGFSPWSVVLLLCAGLPAFVAEMRFSGAAFRLFRWRSPETRQQAYLETLLAREDSIKEVATLGLGPLLLDRYQRIFAKVYAEDRALTLHRNLWGLLLGLLAALALYAAFAWTVREASLGSLSLGTMTLYLLLFKQGQGSVTATLLAVGGLYEDNLYLSTLFELLDLPTPPPIGQAVTGPNPSDGLRFEHVSFTYPDAQTPALQDIDLHVRPGETLALVGSNGSGKTTLIKLLTRLYVPTQGRVLLDGLDLQSWQIGTLRERIAVIFQDFVRYQLLAGENIGAGDVAHFADATRWQAAARKGLADELLTALPLGYQTQLGKWFQGGRELSGGQWQRVALSRALMRPQASILVLDEPTSAMDASAEAEIFDRLQSEAQGRMCILISHRFSTVRRADRIVVLDQGRVQESGTHAELLQSGRQYAHLFELQAKGYR